MAKHVHTGASPGHSYTVKSPSSFSSSDVAPDSETLGSDLFLWPKNKITRLDAFLF